MKHVPQLVINTFQGFEEQSLQGSVYEYNNFSFFTKNNDSCKYPTTAL